MAIYQGTIQLLRNLLFHKKRFVVKKINKKKPKTQSIKFMIKNIRSLVTFQHQNLHARLKKFKADRYDEVKEA